MGLKRKGIGLKKKTNWSDHCDFEMCFIIVCVHVQKSQAGVKMRARKKAWWKRFLLQVKVMAA